jgi:nicotinate phosphoribosyltransferase
MTPGGATNGTWPAAPALLTDLYQLTMVTAYQALGMERSASFEFFVRQLPPARGFLLAAGLEQALDYLAGLRFSPEELRWLEGTGRFRSEALRRLEEFRFTGDVEAMPEGSVFFAGEPILRVTAPLPEAQFVESRIINLLNFQSMIASKAARCRLAAGPRRLVDFGLRRAQGAEAGLLAARACHVAGFDATATVEAGRLFGIPLSGTMAHSFIQAHDDEAAAFRDFARIHPHGLTLLIDTYDTLRAAHKVVSLCRSGVPVEAVRLDSGNLGQLAREVRTILDAGGCEGVRIVASGNLDEHEIARLVGDGAPIDVFGVGTRLDVSVDAPYLDCAYKLQEYAGRPRRKRSTGKATWPGRKQVFRNFNPDGTILADTIGLVDEPLPGRPMLVPAMRGGRRVSQPTLAEIRAHAQAEIKTLPAECRRLREPDPLVATVSDGLRAAAARVDREFP